MSDKSKSMESAVFTIGLDFEHEKTISKNKL